MNKFIKNESLLATSLAKAELTTGRLLTRFVRPIAAAGLMAVALQSSAALAYSAANPFAPPPVSGKLEVPVGNTILQNGEAKATQNHVCAPSATCPSGFAVKLFTPQATLFLALNFTGNDYTHQVITHFFHPNPEDKSAIHARWQSCRDTSTVSAATVPDGASSDPNFVKPVAVAWFLLEIKGAHRGPPEAKICLKLLSSSG